MPLTSLVLPKVEPSKSPSPAPPDDINDRLHKALKQKKNTETVSSLLEEGASIHAKDKDGDNALHLAALKNPHPEVCKLLLSKGAKLEEAGHLGRTALHKAAYSNTGKVVKVLLDKGADIHAKDDRGDTPLHLSTFSNSRPEVTSLLLEKGAKINATGREDRTPLHYAAGWNNKEVALVLLKQGASLGARDADGDTPLHMSAYFNSKPEVTSLLLERGASIKAIGKEGKTPLHYAAGWNSKEVVNALLEKGAELNVKDNLEFTPLHVSSEVNSRSEVSAVLLEKGANISTADKFGYTALHKAAKRNTKEVVRVLLEHGANTSAKSLNEVTPLHRSALNKGKAASEIVELLVKAEPRCLRERDKSGQLPADVARSHEEGNRALVPEFEKWMKISKGQELDLAKIIEKYLSIAKSQQKPDSTELLEVKEQLIDVLESGILHQQLDANEMDNFYKNIASLKKVKGTLPEIFACQWQAMTLMEVACELGYTKVIQELYKIDPALLTESNALTIATDPAVLLLINAIAPEMISNTNSDKPSLAHLMAMSFGDEDQLLKNAEILIRTGDKLKPDKRGVTPTVIAIENNKLKLLDYFLELNPGLARIGSPSPIWFCAATSNVKAAEKLLPHITREDLLTPGPDTSTPYIIARVKKDKHMIKLLQGNLPEADIKEMDEFFTPPVRPALSALSSKIQLKTQLIPAFNDTACPVWEGKQSKKLRVIDSENAIKKHVLEVCGIQHSSSNFISDLVRELEDCTGEHSNRESNLTCHLVTDLLKMVSRLEMELKEHHMLQYLRPSFYLIGSLAECTRIGMGNELDITVSFEAVKGAYFTLGQSSFDVVLTEEGVSFFSQSDLKHLILEDNKFNCSAFVMDILDACVACVERVRLPHRLSIAMKNSLYKGVDCKDCQKAAKEMYGTSQFPPQCHCTKCLPAVTMTKLGPCLLFQWKKDKKAEPINCSIDLIPVLPHSASSAELFQQAVQTLLNERPEGWEQTMKSYFERDRIIVNSHQTGETSFALKIQNFGPNPNFMIRAGQTFDKELFEGPHLKDVYICIKGLKTLLGISSLKSYFVKKVILKPEVQEYAKRNPSKLQLFYQAICQPELRPFFEDKIDYSKLREDIRQRKTEIVLYRLEPAK